jgi:hypothetical protein
VTGKFDRTDYSVVVKAEEPLRIRGNGRFIESKGQPDRAIVGVGRAFDGGGGYLRHGRGVHAELFRNLAHPVSVVNDAKRKTSSLMQFDEAKPSRRKGISNYV